MRGKLTIALAAALLLMACQVDGESSAEKGAKTQETLMQRAIAKVPTPYTSNFLTRQAVAKWMRRMDVPDKLFYVYVMSMTGDYLGYYVAQSRPVSICTFLTPPERRVYGNWREQGMALGTAPALDGVYYKGGGCNSYYFFDAATDALIELSSPPLAYFLADQQLKLDVPRIEVAQ